MNKSFKFFDFKFFYFLKGNNNWLGIIIIMCYIININRENIYNYSI